MRQKIIALALALFVGLLLVRPSTSAQPVAPDPAAALRTLLAADAGKIDFLDAKLVVDQLIDPNTDAALVRSDIDRMAATIRKMLGTLPSKDASTSLARLKALKAFLYRSGQWNNGRPFQYDMDDPLGQNSAHSLLAQYLSTRKGNCVSMPILFAILGERLDLRVTLSTAPLHVFVKYTDAESGATYNLEATSGAGFTRDSWYRTNTPMTDEAIANGVYLKTLTRREAIAVIAAPLIDYLLAVRRYDDAIAVAGVILETYPADAYALVKKGTAYFRLLERDIILKYPRQSDIPRGLVAYADSLYRANQQAFDRAEALGWRSPE